MDLKKLFVHYFFSLFNWQKWASREFQTAPGRKKNTNICVHLPYLSLLDCISPVTYLLQNTFKRDSCRGSAYSRPNWIYSTLALIHNTDKL